MSLFNINYHKIASINIFSYQEYDVFVKAISWIIMESLIQLIGCVVDLMPRCKGIPDQVVIGLLGGIMEFLHIQKLFVLTP